MPTLLQKLLQQARQWVQTSRVAAPQHRTGATPAYRTPSQPEPEQPGFSDGSGSFSRASFTFDDESHSYKIYLPRIAVEAPDSPLPLVLMLHGCTQNPDDFAAGTRMNALAAEHGFVVLYPEQTPQSNAQRCWNWFKPKDQQRDSGEPAWLAALVRHTAQQHAIDPRQIFVAGLSAGGAMASILGHTHPDLFAAVGVHSGLACGVASNIIGALAAMKTGRSKAGAASNVPTIVFHGDADTVVHPHNGEILLQSVIGKHSISGVQTQGQTAQGQHYTRSTYTAANGNSAETWTLHGAGHAWAGGSSTGSYTDPLGPNASAEMWRFFQAHPRAIENKA